ncbi:hypothetical protein DSLASN_48890 [Desulfoluna limicola]|uniref:Type II secretion system protein H n=1 Tax=Desulfoluna limicola TaxID=2810562 RepID=A0ABM7PP10_9BACT|nr:GspH/FimT family protein [Desulfoluna limicola]BCS99257.1 hypothetical protein DSLASN_48890 [Desulfoluna limicola]
MENKKGARGFTLVEMMVVVAMVAIAAGLAFPSMNQFVVNVKTKSAARGIYNLMQHGRIMAVKEGRQVRLQFGDTDLGGKAFSEVRLVLFETDGDGNPIVEIQERFAIEAPVKAERKQADVREVVFTPQGIISGPATGVEVKNTLTTKGYALSVSPLGTVDMSGKTSGRGCS